MRRADGNAASAGRVGTAIRRAAMMTALILMAMAPAGARGDGPAPGQRVVARADRLTLRDDRGAVAGVGGKGQVYRVERADGRRLWLRGEGTELGGWAAADAVVAVAPLADPAVRRADARPHRGFGSLLAAPFRHIKYDAALRRAYAAGDRRDLDQAIVECTEAIRIDPNRAQAYTDRAALWGMKNEPDKVLADCREAIRLNPDNVNAHISSGNAWMLKEQFDKALVELNEAIRIDPRDASAYTNRGWLWILKKEPDKAIADLNEAIRLDPRDAMAFGNRSAVWLMKHEADRSLADSDEAIRLNPRDPGAYGNRAEARTMKGQFDQALADWDEAIRLAPRTAKGHHNRALVWLKKGRYDRALVDFDEAIRLDPRDPWPHNNLAWLRATCPDAQYRDGKKAVESARRACGLNAPKDAYMLGTLAAAYAEAGDFDTAVKSQIEADALYTKPDDKTKGEARLRLYQARTPYRETRP